MAANYVFLNQRSLHCIPLSRVTKYFSTQQRMGITYMIPRVDAVALNRLVL